MDIYKNTTYLKNFSYQDYLLFEKEKYKFANKMPKILKRKFSDLLYDSRSRPIMLLCETVNICSNDCIICPYGMMTRKKTTMSMDVFEKVLSDYSDMGGGYLSLTPKNGEVFLDKLLVERLSLLDKYPKIKGLSVTTNAVPVDRFSDSSLRKILGYFNKIHISIYGLDREEYLLMTKRDFYSKMVSNVKRIVELIDGNKTNLAIGFRFLKKHSEDDMVDWIRKEIGIDIPYGYTYTYMDWNGALDKKTILPFEGKWREKIKIEAHCMLPLITGIVYSNGDVSFCPCNDFDIIEEFRLGNIEDHTLCELFNSNKNIELWSKLPTMCLNCDSYVSMADLRQRTDVFQNPVKYIGG
jgi:radical SAM protein with 4Fe4S-binding SPASM domain